MAHSTGLSQTNTTVQAFEKQNPATTSKIRIDHLFKIFGKQPQKVWQQVRDGIDRQTLLETTGHVLAVADISLTINEGELFVIMGLSGSGKSTLLRCLNQLIVPTSGHVYIDDEDITLATPSRLRELRRTKITMVFQRFALFPHQTVAENIAYGLKVRGVPAVQRHHQALKILQTVGLDSCWANYLPAALSGGMQQRVGLARALATDADILLMDEAFSALDPLIRRDMQDELMRLQAEFKKTIVFISHDIHEALKIGDRVAIMKDGALVQVDTPETIVTAPADDYISAFIQDVNRAQVLRTGSIMRQIPPFVLGHGSVEQVLKHLDRHNRDSIYIVDAADRPVGWVDRPRLNTNLKDGQTEVARVMQPNFPKAHTSLTLEAIFHLCKFGMPVAIVGSDGKLQGVLEQADIFAHIGR